MSLALHFHPLSSYCWKALIGLYENGTPFTPVLLDFGDATAREAFLALSPLGKMPVLRDEARGETVPETTVILDYLDRYYPGPVRFVPADPDLAWRVRLWDRVCDLHLQDPMQRIVGDRLRPADDRDPTGVARARAHLATGRGVIEREIAGRTWLSGDAFGLADCAALPALYYADKVQPLGADFPASTAYLARLMARPSVERVLAEAEPFFKFFPEA